MPENLETFKEVDQTEIKAPPYLTESIEKTEKISNIEKDNKSIPQVLLEMSESFKSDDVKFIQALTSFKEKITNFNLNDLSDKFHKIVFFWLQVIIRSEELSPKNIKPIHVLALKRILDIFKNSKLKEADYPQIITIFKSAGLANGIIFNQSREPEIRSYEKRESAYKGEL